MNQQSNWTKKIVGMATEIFFFIKIATSILKLINQSERSWDIIAQKRSEKSSVMRYTWEFDEIYHTFVIRSSAVSGYISDKARVVVYRESCMN